MRFDVNSSGDEGIAVYGRPLARDAGAVVPLRRWSQDAFGEPEGK